MSESQKKNEIKVELRRMLPQFKAVSKMITTAEDSWTKHYNENDPEDMYLRTMFYRIGEKLDDVRDLLRSVTSEVVETGKIHHNESKRYELPSGHYYTSGSSIEFLRQERNGPAEWVASSVEHNGDDYYIVADRNLPMAGLTVRRKNYPSWD